MRKIHRKILNRLLEKAGDEEFIQLLWATHTLQSTYSSAAGRYVRPETIPDGAMTTVVMSPLAIRKWELETLANELMTVPKNTNGGSSEPWIVVIINQSPNASIDLENLKMQSLS